MIHSIHNLLHFHPFCHYRYHRSSRTLRTATALIATLPSGGGGGRRLPAHPSQNSGTAILPAATPTRYCCCTNNPSPSALDLKSSSDVVRNFYDGINRRDLPSIHHLIALNCVYEDLVFPTPFLGRQAILEFFNNFIHSISADLQFAIDDISEEDTSAVGVTWHLEWKGKPFPFSKGCSFYRLEVVDGQKQIVYGRDCVEPAIKPGETALVAIRGVTWLLQKFPFLADRL